MKAGTGTGRRYTVWSRPRSRGQPSGYGSSLLSPPETVSQDVLLQFGHGGSDFTDPVVISSPQLVHR